MTHNKLDKIVELLEKKDHDRLTKEELVLVRELIEKLKEDKEIRKALKTKLLSHGMLAGLTAIGSILSYLFFNDLFKF